MQSRSDLRRRARPMPSRPKNRFPCCEAQLKTSRGAIGAGRRQSVAHHHHRAGCRPGHQAYRRQRRYAAVGQALDDVRAARRMGDRQFQGDPARPDAAGPAGRLSRSTPIPIAPSKATSTASSPAAAPRSVCCRRRTPPAITSRSCSACRSRSCSTSRPTCCSGRACRSCRRSRCDERSGAAARRLGFQPLGRRRPQSLAGRRRGLDRHLHGRARHRDRQCLAALHRRQPRRQRRREHLGGHDLSDRQRRHPAGERLAVECARPQALLHDLRRAVHGELAVLRAGAESERR